MLTARVLTATIAGMLLVSPALTGVAGAASPFGGTVAVNNMDVWTLTCNAASTHCMEIQVCDYDPSSADTWFQALVATSPLTLLGKGVDFRTTSTGGCNPSQSICRPSTTAGPMKGLIVVAHPDGAGSAIYTLTVNCLDKTLTPISASHTVLKKTTDDK
jgi:hypothetical protein